MTTPSVTQRVREVLAAADEPLTVADIQARIEQLQPLTARNPQAAIRSAVSSIYPATTLGGRPARYTWWPRHLAENRFRQPLAGYRQSR